jgi:putative transposase
MDFMTDSLVDGRRFRVLTIVDDFSRESLYIGVAFRFTGQQVADIVEELKTRRGASDAIRVDNGPEFTSVALDQWAYWNQVTLIFSRPGKPTDNGLIESFNARLRQECLNAHWFLSLEEAQREIEAWRRHYNRERPHSSLGDLTPEEFVQMHQISG